MALPTPAEESRDTLAGWPFAGCPGDTARGYSGNRRDGILFVEALPLRAKGETKHVEADLDGHEDRGSTPLGDAILPCNRMK